MFKKKAFFIVFEGIEGCGKSFQSKKLYLNLKKKKFNTVLTEMRQLPEWSEDTRGFDFYMRAMYTQSGGGVKTNYFTHKDRAMCEQRVLEANY